MQDTQPIIFLFSRYIDVITPVVAILVASLRTRAFGRFPMTRFTELCLNQLLFWVVGFQSLFVFVLHTWHPEITAILAGWPAVPIGYQLNVVNLSYGIIGLLSTFSSLGFKAASAIGYSIWIFGAGIGHLINIFSNIADQKNLGLVLYTNLGVPILLMLLLMTVYQNQKSNV